MTHSTHDPISMHRDITARLDTLRVKLHLGGMDAQDEFAKISHEVSELGRKAVNATKAAAQELLARVEALDAKLAPKK